MKGMRGKATKESVEHVVSICVKQMAEAGTRPILVDADVSDESQVSSMFERVLAEYGRID